MTTNTTTVLASVAMLIVPLALVAASVAAIFLMRSRRIRGFVVQPSSKLPKGLDSAIRYALALVAVGAAAVLMAWLLQWGPMPTYITFYPAVLLVAIVLGGGPGVFATLLSVLATAYWFVEPYGSFEIHGTNNMISMALFTITNLVLCVIAERLRRSRWAEAFGRAKEEEAAVLARKNEELSQQAEELAQQTEELTQQSNELYRQNEELQSQSEEIRGSTKSLRARKACFARCWIPRGG